MDVRSADADPPAAGSRPRLVAFRLDTAAPMPLVPASGHREWMQNTPSRYANRCLPLRISNQFGWFVLSSHAVRATWSGTEDLDGVEVETLGGPGAAPAVSHFGSGILTWHLPYLFRTPAGYDLVVRGPTNADFRVRG